LRQPGPLFWIFVLAGCFSIALLALMRGHKAARRAALVWSAAGLIVLIGSCGGGSTTPPAGGGGGGTPVGTSSITVTANSATSHTTALTITVTP
jgi:hypothetical protein